MNELTLTIKKDEVWVGSRDIAEKFSKSHKNVLRDIQNLDCSEEFSRLNFGLSNYEIRGKKYPEYFMTKDGFTILAMGYTGKKAMEFKEAYIKEFNKMRNILTQRQTIEWKNARRQTKLTHRDETDTLKLLAVYAKDQGSTHYDKLYMTYSTLANKMVGVKDRDTATITQLNNLSLIENVILHVVRQGMELGRHYKEIYQDCKQRLEQLLEIAYLGI